MGYGIILTQRALNDLVEIARHVAQDDPRFAKEFSNKLIDRTIPLSGFPQLGRVVPEFGRFSIREVIRNPYRIIYRIREREQVIEVLRFWHGARGTPRI